ncbi:MAG: hypothetical protein RR290_01655 [Clostridia bacterium]
MNFFTNKGITLLVLVVTISISIILITTATIFSSTVIENAKLTTFVNDLNDIENSVESYYINNLVFPILEKEIPLKKDDILLLARKDAKLKLNDEIKENEDLDSTFYKIDLSKINVTKTNYGNGKKGENDIFVVAYPSFKIYYLYGMDSKSTTYFSITPKLSSVVKIKEPILDSSTICTSAGIIVNKSNNWSNKMKVNIEVKMEIGEQLFMSVSGYKERLITTKYGNNIFGFDLLSSIVNNTETIKVPTLTLEEANFIEDNIKSINERYVDILKYKDSKLIGKVKIDLSNFNKSIPMIENIILSTNENMNTIMLQLKKSDCGIKEIRFEYLKKYIDNYTVENYYEGINDFDNIYMLSKGKKAKIKSDLSASINVPKNVQIIKIILVDKADNINSYNQEISSNKHINYKIDSNIKPELTLTANFLNITEAINVKFSKSIDGINFTDEITYSISVNEQKKQHTFYNVNSDRIYVKLVINNKDNSIEETKIIKCTMLDNNVPDKPIEPEKPGFSYNNPIIPVGFTYKEGAWNTGYVIEDNKHNEFVWVPVDNINVKYKKIFSYLSDYNAGEKNTSEDELPIGVKDEQEQIKKYGGFYIARYEAGKEGETLVIKKDSKVWNNINYTNAKIKAESFINTSSVKSGLVTGTMWDTLLRWINNSGNNVIDSKAWGNHKDSTKPANVTGFGSLQKTGFSQLWQVNNIYDIAGNALEWTNEKFDIFRIYRSGCYSLSGTTDPASYRYSNFVNNSLQTLSFRIVLYIN